MRCVVIYTAIDHIAGSGSFGCAVDSAVGAKCVKYCWLVNKDCILPSCNDNKNRYIKEGKEMKKDHKSAKAIAKMMANKACGSASIWGYVSVQRT